MRLIYWVFIFFLFSADFCVAQEKQWGIEVNPKLGFLLAHRGVMGHLPRKHAFGGELTYYIQTHGARKFEEAYNYPKIGLTLFGSSVGNDALLGQVYGLYSFIDFPFAKSEKMELCGRMGAGASWNTKVFDQELNPKNVAMSTHLNALICLGLRYRVFFGNTHLVAGIDLTHCSNGSTKVPNLGINLPYISLGVGRTFATAQQIHSTEKFVKKKWDLTAIGILSVKEVFPTGGKKYPIYAFSLVGKKIFSARKGMEVAFDFIYKTSINAYHTEIPKTKQGIAQLGLYCGYVLPLDKLQFVLGMGVYVRDKYKPDSPLYHRLGMRYQLTERIMLNFTLKTHWAKADYVEYGIGYTF